MNKYGLGSAGSRIDVVVGLRRGIRREGFASDGLLSSSKYVADRKAFGNCGGFVSCSSSELYHEYPTSDKERWLAISTDQAPL